MGPLKPYLRGAPPGLPFRFDADTLSRGLNFTLTTSLGWIDLLGEITGGGRFDGEAVRQRRASQGRSAYSAYSSTGGQTHTRLRSP